MSNKSVSPSMMSAVMSKLAKDGVKKRHKGMTKEEKHEYYSTLAKRKSAPDFSTGSAKPTK